MLEFFTTADWYVNAKEIPLLPDFLKIISIIGVLITGIWLSWKQLRASFKLLRKFHIGRNEGSWWRIIIYLLFIFFKHPIRSTPNFFRLVRLNIEFQCLKPYPIQRVNCSDEEFKKEMKKWKGEYENIIDFASIELANPGIIQKYFKEIDRYFDALENLKACTVLESTSSFISEVKVEDGFVAPLHLMTGLMQKFDEDWQTSIDAYEADLKDKPIEIDSQDTQDELKNLKNIQRFIFDCWLQWGQSIPLCSSSHCSNFKGYMGSLQYGYGDEDNSIELIDDRNQLVERWRSLNAKQGILAIRTKVKGKISSSRFFENKEGFGDTLSHSWGTDEKGDERLIIKDISSFKLHPRDSSYYSAYVWVVFIILKKIADNQWVPANYVNEPKKEEFLWRAIIPFFEHGNIAEKSTFDLMKQQLAVKSIIGLSKIVKNWKDKNKQKSISDYPLRFAFACSLDFSGCESKDKSDFLAKDHIEENLKIPFLLKEAVQNQAMICNGFDEIILFDRKELLHTCDLPELIISPYLKYAETIKDIKSKN